MARVTNPLLSPNSSTEMSNAKQKLDIPYNYWPARLKRYIKNFIKIVLVVGVLGAVIAFATTDDVSMNMVLSGITTALQIGLQIMTLMAGIVLQFGLLFWFLGRPKVEIIKPGDNTTVTFADYWGQPQLVKLVKQWMFLLRDRKEFEKMGGKYISGLLLYGPPGTGKTMLAKAIAGESGMAFISAEGTSFQAMFMGMDILKVLRFSAWARQLAKKYGACVAYIDEIDAIGMSRGGVRGGGATQMMGGGMGMGMMGMMALSTLLSQMDGINKPSRLETLKSRFYSTFGQRYIPKPPKWNVMWMGSTNRPDVLDPALTRSGRLDTKIAVEAPDRASRRLIIQGYLKKIKSDDTIDLEAIVGDTNGLTPADIAGAITKDAVRIAFFDGRKLVGQKDIEKAFMEQSGGMEMPIEEFDEGQRRVLAHHEAGHAVAQYYMMPEQKIVRATIVRLSTGSYGHMQPIDTVEQHITPVNRLAYDVIVYFAGRCAERIYSGEIYQSVGGDFPGIRYMMWRLVENGFFGPPLAGGANGPMGASYDQYLRGDESTLKKYWMMMEDATDKLLRKHWREVSAVAEELLVKNTLSGKDVVAVIEGNQTADSLKDDIIPKTLAAIRAQALAEARRGNDHGTYMNGNGFGTGILIEQPAGAYGARASAAPTAPVSPTPVPTTNEHTPRPAPATPPAEETVVINGASNGGYAPRQVDEDNTGRYVPRQVDE